MDHPTSPPKMPVTIAPPPGAMVCYGVAADAHLDTPMKKSRSDERLSGVDLQEARAQFHQMLSRERPDLNNRDKGRIVRSTINHKTADNLDAAIQQKMANLEGERQVRPGVRDLGCHTRGYGSVQFENISKLDREFSTKDATMNITLTIEDPQRVRSIRSTRSTAPSSSWLDQFSCSQ